MKIPSPTKERRYRMEASDDAPPVSPSMETKPAGVSFSVDVEEEEKKVEFSEYSSTTKKALRKVPKRYIKQTVDKDDNTSGGKDKKGLLKRIFGGDKRKESSQILDTSLENDGEAEDPVMTIFQSRNTQRVRFALEEGVESDEPKTKEKNLGVKQFMSRALFSSTKSSKKLKEEIEREVAELGGSLVWQSIETSTGSEVVYSKSSNKKQNSEPTPSFSEDPKIRSKHAKLLSKAKRAENHFRYEYAVKCYLKAVNMMKMAKYPEDYPTVTRTHELLNSAHQMLSSYNNSVRIVKLGIRHEDSGELVRALKMYTIAYRIRRDNLSRIHPSHVVLLNMLGSIQVKRGELKEAMLIYELALKDATVSISISETGDNIQSPIGNLLAKSVTFREMGIINEHWGNLDMALEVYHKSLECVAEWKRNAQLGDDNDAGESNDSGNEASITSLEFSFSEFESDTGEVEVCLSSKKESRRSVSENKNVYESYFPSRLDDELDNNRSISKGQDNNTTISKDSYADMDIALTLHQIAQLHRKQGQFAEALDAFQVSLRGMKYSLGRVHPNVAAVLGNIGNLQKEMGNLDAAYITYQEVLGIESYRLGLSHPDVAITLHNIATIDAARGNYKQGLDLYLKVIGLQRKIFGPKHLSVAITAACMGDVYEKIGEYTTAMEYFEESLRIKTAANGRHSLDVARLLHKLGKMAFLSGDYHTAESFISRTVLIYRLNKVEKDHEWIVDANRDSADIDAAIALGKARAEC